MNIRKTAKGFTLVEMLVVIAIIAILAAALFPAIQNAMSSAQATALKSKARGIWTAVSSANMEREPLNKGSVWPGDVWADADLNVSKSSVAYFNFLLSNETDPSKPTSAEDIELRVAGDLQCVDLIASGITPGQDGTALTEANVAWGVVDVKDTTPGNIPFLITKNYSASNITQGDDDKEPLLGNDETVKAAKPFGNKRAVWITRGGGTFDARRKYFTQKQLAGEGSEEYAYFVQ